MANTIFVEGMTFQALLIGTRRCPLPVFQSSLAEMIWKSYREVLFCNIHVTSADFTGYQTESFAQVKRTA